MTLTLNDTSRPMTPEHRPKTARRLLPQTSVGSRTSCK